MIFTESEIAYMRSQPLGRIEEESASLPSGIDGPFISIHPTRILTWGLDAPDSTSPKLIGMPYNARDVAPHAESTSQRKDPS
jgi:hypothetical protein